MNRRDFKSLDKMIQFIRTELRHCIGVNANWVVALALSSYTEAFGHLLPHMQNASYPELQDFFYIVDFTINRPFSAI